MPWVFLLLAVVLITALALVLSGRLPAVPQPTDDRYTLEFTTTMDGGDVDRVRFPVVFRGYRMQDVDAAILALQERIVALETKPGDAPDRAGDETRRRTRSRRSAK